MVNIKTSLTNAKATPFDKQKTQYNAMAKIQLHNPSPEEEGNPFRRAVNGTDY